MSFISQFSMTILPEVVYEPSAEDDITPYKIKLIDVVLESFHTAEDAAIGLDAYKRS